MATFNATYNVEDDKLRIACSEYWDRDLFNLMRKELGFTWAPMQECFFAKWSPAREDKLIELAEDIVADDITMLERAEAKRIRLEGYVDNNIQKANRFAVVADKLAVTQPILAGHHSQRKMERMKDQQERAQEQSMTAFEAVRYLTYKAQGVIAHANRKNSTSVRVGRIETLLKELRDCQRSINEGYTMVQFWTKALAADEGKKQFYADNYLGAMVGKGRATYRLSPYGLWGDVRDGKLSIDEAFNKALKCGQQIIGDERKIRHIAHLLGRLGYENAMLGGVSKYPSAITATVLKDFARKFGVDAPEATKQENGDWLLSSDVFLPYFFSEDGELVKTLELGEEEWKTLFVDLGYEVVVRQSVASKVPLLNFKAEKPLVLKTPWSSELQTFEQIEMTKEEYAKIYTDYKGTYVGTAEDGSKYRVRICMQGNFGRKAVFLTNSKAHSSPLAA
jgi:hypothetical protein